MSCCLTMDVAEVNIKFISFIASIYEEQAKEEDEWSKQLLKVHVTGTSDWHIR